MNFITDYGSVILVVVNTLFWALLLAFLCRDELKKEIAERIKKIKMIMRLVTWLRRLKYGPNDFYFYEEMYIDKKRNCVILPVLLKTKKRPIFNDGVLFFLSEQVEKKYPNITLTGKYDYVTSKAEVIEIFLVIKGPKVY